MEPQSKDPEKQPTHSASGVDLTLIRWMLSLTPDNRFIKILKTLVDRNLAIRYLITKFGPLGLEVSYRQISFGALTRQDLHCAT